MPSVAYVGEGSLAIFGGKIIAMSGRSYTPVYFESQLSDGTVSRILFKAKALVYTCGRTFWELRRVLLAFHHDIKNIKVCKLVKQHAPGWQLLCGQLGFDWKVHFRASARALRACVDDRGEMQDRPMEVVDEYTRDEAVVSTEALVAILANWACFRRSVKDRELGKDFLVKLFARVLTPEQILAYPLADAATDARAHCVVPEGAVCCMHLSPIDFGWAARRRGDAHAALVALLLALASHSSVCEAARCIASGLIRWVGVDMHKSLPSAGDDDATKQPHLHGAKRKMRVDEDYKVAKMVRSTTSGQTATSAQALAADRDFAHESMGRFWAEQHLSRHVAKLWSLTDGRHLSGVHCIVEDGTRLGSPAEETQIYGYYNFSARAGGWLLAQVVGAAPGEL